jgi:hypothetical protein
VYGWTIDRERFEHMLLTILDPSEEADSSGCNDREKQYADLGVRLSNLSHEGPERVPGLRVLPGKLYAKTRVLRRAQRLAPFVGQWGSRHN